MFMDTLPMPTKRRVHFHAFMTELHRRMNSLPPADPRAKKDLVQRLAEELAAEATVLGFDEFYLTNLPDAMFLGRLMQALFNMGVVVVATSNWALPDLFQGGLHRDRFMPFLRLLESHLEPFDLTEGQDYRVVGRPKGPNTTIPMANYVQTKPGESAEAQLAVLFTGYAEGPDQPEVDTLTPKRQRGRALWVTFAELCDRALGREEYQQLASWFDTIVIENIPQLSAREADSALRLATFVDIAYEHRRRLVVSAAVPPQLICTQGDAAQVFQRTASRLVELTGA
jgi:cell division protein ZapE